MLAAIPLPSNGTFLFLDASGLRLRVGLLKERRWLAWRESAAPALEALFIDTQAILTEACYTLDKVDGFIYAEGPGSVLGLRLAAMAIRTWQVDIKARYSGRQLLVSSCGSMSLAAALAYAAGTPLPFSICTEARQDCWHLLTIADASSPNFSLPKIIEVMVENLPAGTLFHLPARKAWHSPPSHAQPVPTSLLEHPEIFQFPGILNSVETATPYSAHAPEYKKWIGAKS